MKMLTPEVRAWIYRILIAVGALVAGFGWATSDQVALVIGVAVAVLNVMPASFTSTKRDDTFQGGQ